MSRDRLWGGITTAVLLALVGVALVVVVGPPLLFWLVARPPSPGTGTGTAVGERARDLAYALRDERVRRHIDGGDTAEEVAALVGAPPATADRVAAIGDPGTVDAGMLLLGVEPVGRTGVAIRVVEGGVLGPTSSWTSATRPWVTCLRIELPATRIDAIAWSVTDTACPTFAPSVRQDAARVPAADLPHRPLLRPPCYGTTGYCPGG